MSRFLIETEHTKEECLKALDDLAGKGPEILGQYEFGCGAGTHTGWATVEARDAKEALKNVPEFLLKKTRVVPVETITPEQIRAYHK